VLLLLRVDLEGVFLISDSLLLLSNNLFSRSVENDDDEEEESFSYSIDSFILD